MENILDLSQHRLSTADHAKIYATTATAFIEYFRHFGTGVHKIRFTA
jgi:hypothetical protein